jgi:hypothetical protein
LYTRNSNSGTLRARSWILTLSPGVNVRVVESENDRGASLLAARARPAAESTTSRAAQSVDLAKGDFRSSEFRQGKFR